MASQSPRKLILGILFVLVIALVLFVLFRANSTQPAFRGAEAPSIETPKEKGMPKKGAERPARMKPKENGNPAVKKVKMEEDAFAVQVEGEPLLVTLPWYDDIGEISIERYDKEGNATGQPLKSGTMVQISDPLKPGERIRFIVP